jgi:8-oxo-dGTP diphosphatase
MKNIFFFRPKKPARFAPLVAVHLFLFKKESVLLARRFNTGYEDGKYSVPAGHIDGNETITQAMIREAKEEIGIRIKPRDLEVVHVMHRHSPDDERVDFFLVAARWEGEPEIKEPDKCDQLGWFKSASLPANLVPYVRTALERTQQGQSFSEFGWE